MKQFIRNTIKKTGLLLAAAALSSCSNPVDSPDNIGAITGFVIIGSMPTADVQITLDGTITRSTNNAGQYRFVDLIVGDSHTVAVASSAVPKGVEMHVSEHAVTVPDTHVAYVNFFGSKRQQP